MRNVPTWLSALPPAIRRVSSRAGRNRSRGSGALLLMLAVLLSCGALLLSGGPGAGGVAVGPMSAPGPALPTSTLREAAAAAPAVVPEDAGSSPAPSESTAPTTPSVSDAALPAADAALPSAGPALPTAAAPLHLRYPGVDLDMTVLPLTPDQEETAAGVLVPPITMDAYWLTPYGQPGAGSRNTTYIVGHSWEDADAPFNRLSNSARVGDEFLVSTAAGSIRYRVQAVTTHDKDSLRTSDVWDIVPNRLVLISCYTEDLWGKNVLVSAAPVG
ncbi:MAG: peptidase [Micrococcaceae bacterium]|nr:peptidase [Micrococcaceae bacterium]